MGCMLYVVVNTLDSIYAGKVFMPASGYVLLLLLRGIVWSVHRSRSAHIAYKKSGYNDYTSE